MNTFGLFTGDPNDPFGFSSDLTGNTGSGFNLDDYISGGGLIATGGGTNAGATSSDFDFFSGLGDFFSGLTQNLPQLAEIGLGTYKEIQNIIAQDNPQDKLVMIPGSNIPVIQRTEGGRSSYYPISQLYPGLAPQVQKAQQNSWILPVAIVGALGLGFLLLRK